jgi:hypothetical protein
MGTGACKKKMAVKDRRSHFAKKKGSPEPEVGKKAPSIWWAHYSSLSVCLVVRKEEKHSASLRELVGGVQHEEELVGGWTVPHGPRLRQGINVGAPTSDVGHDTTRCGCGGPNRKRSP